MNKFGEIWFYLHNFVRHIGTLARIWIMNRGARLIAHRVWWNYSMVLWCEIRTDHDDVIKWQHFPRYWPFARGIQRSPVNSTHKVQWRVALLFSLICAWINGWVNNRGAGDLRCYRAHNDVTVMCLSILLVLGHPVNCLRSRYTQAVPYSKTSGHASLKMIIRMINNPTSIPSNPRQNSYLKHITLCS